MKTALILGAKSGLGTAVSELLAERKVNLIWAARNASTLYSKQKELSEKFSLKIEIVNFDALDFSSHQKFADLYGDDIDAVFCFIGYLPNQQLASNSLLEQQKTFDTNFRSLASILDKFALKFERKKSGWIVGVSSIAGERVRPHNLFYGTAKNKFTWYLNNLNIRLKANHVKVLTVKPGYFATPMTANLKLPKFLIRQPQVAAKDILYAMDNDKEVVFTPWFWKYVSVVVKIVPEFILNRI